MTQRTLSGIPGVLRMPVFVAIAYYLGAESAFGIGTLSDRIFAPFWPPNSILFCALLLAPKRRWWLYIVAAFPAHAIAELSVGMPANELLVAFATNCLVAIMSAIGVQHFLKEPPWFGTLRNAAIYLLITTGLSPAISALGGAFVQILGGGSFSSYWTFWGNWYIANALGSVTLAPILLLCFGSRADLAPFTTRRKIEAALLIAGLIVTCNIAFEYPPEALWSGFLPAILYSPIPLILYATIRFGELGANSAILVVTVVATWRSLPNPAIFIGHNADASVLPLQVFLLGIAIPIFFLGAAIDELRRSNDATRKLTGALLRVQDEERRRIARELHDSTGQNLVVASLMAERLKPMAPESCEPVITDLRGILQTAITEIRTMSHLLHPPVLDGIGLGVTLKTYVYGFTNRTGIDVDLDVADDFGRLPSAVETVFFRVTQEGLTNIWRHAESTSARIQLSRQADAQVTLSIEDNGKGMPQGIRVATASGVNEGMRIPTGLGLVGMRERLRQIGGRLEIDSIPGKTVVRAIVSLPEEIEELESA